MSFIISIGGGMRFPFATTFATHGASESHHGSLGDVTDRGCSIKCLAWAPVYGRHLKTCVGQCSRGLKPLYPITEGKGT